MLQPKITKYRRPFSLKYEGNSKAGNSVVFGDYGLIALEGTISLATASINSLRRAIATIFAP